MNSLKSKERICNNAREIEETKSIINIFKRAALIRQLLFFYLYAMADDLNIITGTKEEQYTALLPQIRGLLEGEPDLIANLANVAAALKEQFNWLWVGFYLVKDNAAKNVEELVLGPFQGPVACTRIRKGKGVCGSTWERGETLLVPDVEKFPGHIACSSLSRSEIVVPLIKNGKVMGVLDVDSEDLDQFNETDKKYLEEIVKLVRF
jgi:GAF domain-containing protein